MIRVTSADAQNRFGQLLDMAQREPVVITRHGRTAGYVIAAQDMEILMDARLQRSQALAELDAYSRQLEAQRSPDVAAPTEPEIADEIRAVRRERSSQA